jgi:type II secretory pathway component PulC
MIKRTRGISQKFTILYIVFSLWTMDYGLWTNLCLAQKEDTPLSYYEIIEQRNFFRPSEDSEAKTQEENLEKRGAVAPEVPPLVVSDLVLTGIVKIKNNYKAIIERKSGGEGYYVEVDDIVGDYLVEDIHKTRVILRKGKQIFELQLRKKADKESEETDDKSYRESGQESGQTQEENPSNSEMKYQENALRKLRMGQGGI